MIYLPKTAQALQYDVPCPLSPVSLYCPFLLSIFSLPPTVTSPSRGWVYEPLKLNEPFLLPWSTIQHWRDFWGEIKMQCNSILFSWDVLSGNPATMLWGSPYIQERAWHREEPRPTAHDAGRIFCQRAYRAKLGTWVMLKVHPPVPKLSCPSKDKPWLPNPALTADSSAN